MSDRLSKEGRKELKRPDAFVAWGRSKVEALAADMTKVLILVIAVLVIVFGWYGYTLWAARQAEKAWEAFYSASQVEEAGRWAAIEKMSTDFRTTRAGSYAAVTVADHYLQLAKAKVEKDIESTVSAEKGPKKKEANFAVNLTALPTEKENSAKAAEWYGKAKDFSGLTSDERQLLEINVANALEISGDLPKAEEAYQQAAKSSSLAKGAALLGAGRVIEMRGERDRAVKLYQDIIQEFSGNEKNREYERLAQSALRRVQSKLFNAEK